MWEDVKHRLEGSKDSFSLKENCEVGKYEIWECKLVRGEEMQRCGKNSENKNLLAPQKEEKYNSKHFNLLTVLCLKLTVIKHRHQPSRECFSIVYQIQALL